MKRFRNFFCPRCLRANRDTPGDEQQGAKERSDFFPVHTGASIDDEKLQNLQKQLDIEMRVKDGAENLLLAYCQGPITKQKTLNAVQKMYENSLNKIQALRMQILQAKKQRQGTPPDNGEAPVTPVTQLNKVSDPAVEEAPEMGNIMAAELEVEESAEKDAEAILEIILEQVFQKVADTMPVPVVEEAPEMGNIMPTGLEVEESPEMDAEAILESILDRVFQLTTDTVSVPALEEALEMANIMPTGLEVEDSPEKDAEAILEIILDRVFELVSDTFSVPALEEAPEMANIMPAGLEVEESLETAIEAIVESILDHVFQLVPDTLPVSALEEAPETVIIMRTGIDLDESPEKDIEAIVESILEHVFEMVTNIVSVPALEEIAEMEIDSVSVPEVDKQIQDLPSSGHQSPICVLDPVEDQEVHPAPPEAPNQEPDMESPEKDIEAIVESILEQVFEMVTDASCVPALAEAPEEEIENVSEEEMDKQIQDLPSSGMQSQRKIGLQNFRLCAVLGRGAYGKVLLAECKTSKQMVALKALKKTHLIENGYVYRLMREKEAFLTISSDRHPFLVNLIASFQTETHAIFAMEYAAGGDLSMHLGKTREGFPKPRAMFYAACVILGVECLHRHNIVHRDLKAENIVLDQEGFAKITDFGLCKSGMGFRRRARTWCGTLPYMAPEIITDRSYTRAVDWWSVGVLIYSMLVGRRPFTGDTRREIKNNIVHAPVSFPKNFSKKGTALLRLLLDKNPTLRLGASETDAAEVKEHRFFRKINWTNLLERQMTPPFLPAISSPEDVSNFSRTMTYRAPVLTPPSEASLTEEDQEEFDEFDWIAD